MSSSQASSDGFPRLVGAENFDVWKTRVCADLHGKHLLGYVMTFDYDGVSEDESDESESSMSDVDEARKVKPAEKADADSDAVDYEDSDNEELKPTSDSDEDSGSSSDTSIKSKDLPVVPPFSQAQERKNKEKRTPLSKRQLRRREALTVTFRMKTIDNTGEESDDCLPDIPVYMQEV
ncbi:hypothetical protein PI124_g6978 [Phytophthora idaei]|nr:hypothetical protein PI125_g1112 [Phytophthora idaei]KAG3160579.1 hypothetical protein PI126_g6857 [Phytophthora idaei]KAG3248351.1 hypothetical protein PI124_g6978 [Phytophthora idaei]